MERCFEVLGEAASKVPPNLRVRYPDLPWTEMIAVRNRVAYAYFNVDLAILYRTASDVLPGLLPGLERMLTDVAADDGAEDDSRSSLPATD